MSIGILEKALQLGSNIQIRLFTLLLSSQMKQIGSRCSIAPPLRFHGLGSISLGDGVVINRDCWLQTVGDDDDQGQARLVIKSHAGIGMGASISAAKQVVIGEYALLARNVYISDHAHAFENIAVPIMHQGITGIAPVNIGRGAWLGQNVVVLPGVTIGEHSVIGANSVVNSCIPDYTVAAGAPARVIKRYDKQAGAWVRAK